MDIPHELAALYACLAIVIGGVQCFFGYRVFRLILGLVGCLLGSMLASSAAHVLTAGNPVATIIAALVGGILGGMLCFFLFYVGLFLLGATLGVIVGGALFAICQAQPQPLLLLVMAVIAGIVTVACRKLMIVVATAFGGAWGIVTGGAHFLVPAVDLSDPQGSFAEGGPVLYAMMAAWMVLGIAGFAAQFRARRAASRTHDGPRLDPDRTL